MKRNIILSVCLCAVLLLVTGCGRERTLVCTQTASGVDITFNVGFKGNTIKTMDFSYDMDLTSYNDAQIEAIGKQDLCTTVKNSMAQYKDAFTDCKQNIENKHLRLSSRFDVDKIAKNQLDKMTSPEKAKEDLETQGYSCTIN